MSHRIIESLLALGGKKKDKSIDLLSTDLMIRDKDSRHEYTIDRVDFDEGGKPIVSCYRYYGPRGEKKAYVRLTEKDFDNYEPV